MFLKYGKLGEPAYRIVRVSSDLKKIEWMHSGEKKPSNSMKIDKLTGIKFGRNTSNFMRFPIKNQKQEDLSFTVYSDSRNLDLEANIQSQVDLFIEGLVSVIQYHESEGSKLTDNSTTGGKKNNKKQ